MLIRSALLITSVSRSRKVLASGSVDLHVNIYSTETYQLLQSILSQIGISCVCFVDERRTLVGLKLGSPIVSVNADSGEIDAAFEDIHRFTTGIVVTREDGEMAYDTCRTIDDLLTCGYRACSSGLAADCAVRTLRSS